MSRGIDGMDIFRSDQDRQQFLLLLWKYLDETRMKCYAWSLMPNHYHLVIRNSELPLVKLMKPLNSCYAGYYNSIYKRRGYLFQDRFKSIATQEQRYIEEMVRYVHLNPVRAGICKNIDELDHYAWCGHSAIMGYAQYKFQDTKSVLDRFGKNLQQSRIGYRNYLVEALKENSDRDPDSFFRKNTQGGICKENPSRWVIGDTEFVKNALKSDIARRIRIRRYAVEKHDIEKVSVVISKELRIKPIELIQPRKKDASAKGRKILAYVCHRKLEIPVIEIAGFLKVGGTAVSMMLKEGERLYKKTGLTLFD